MSEERGYATRERRDRFGVGGRSYELRSEVFTPEGAILSLAVLAPSWFTQGGRVRAWARALAKEGTLCTVVHFPGHGVTEGRRGVIDLDEQVASIHHAKEQLLMECPYGGAVFLGGSSGGLTAALYAAAEQRDVCGVFGISPFINLAAYRPLRDARVQERCAVALQHGAIVDLSNVDGRQRPTNMNVAESMPSLQRMDLEQVTPHVVADVWVAYGADDEIIDSSSIERALRSLGTAPEFVRVSRLPAGHGLAGYEEQVERECVAFVRMVRGRYWP